MATGILWSVIIGLWAAYLVPLWIARHDTSRLDAQAGLEDPDHVVLPGRAGDAAGAVPVEDRTRGQTGTDKAAPRRRRGTRVTRLLARRRARLVARRRRTLSGLVLTLVVILVAVPLGPMPGWAAAAGAVVLGGYLVHLRRQARRAQFSRPDLGAQQRRAPRARARGASAEPASAEPMSPPSRPAPAPTGQRSSPGGRPRQATGAGRPQDAQESTEEGDSRPPASTSLWQPLPVPLPTYVTRPRAIHPAREVELSRAAAWSSARFGSDVALRWHAAPTGPDLSVGADVPAPTAQGKAAAPVCGARPAATSSLVHEPEVRRAVGG